VVQSSDLNFPIELKGYCTTSGFWYIISINLIWNIWYLVRYSCRQAFFWSWIGHVHISTYCSQLLVISLTRASLQFREATIHGVCDTLLMQSLTKRLSKIILFGPRLGAGSTFKAPPWLAQANHTLPTCLRLTKANLAHIVTSNLLQLWLKGAI
jgi:hypothetical protein